MTLTKIRSLNQSRIRSIFPEKEKKERKGRNPATGDAMILEARKVVTFKCSGKLKDRINGQ